MIPFGPWHPDIAGINTKCVRQAMNVFPNASGFTPARSIVATTNALDSACVGAFTVARSDGLLTSFAGTASKLYKLSVATWGDASRTIVGAYSTASGDRWKFTVWGDTAMATNYTDAPQKFDLVAGTNWTALGGSPPNARFIDVVRDQIWLGAVNGNLKRVQWSGIGLPEYWTPGTNNSDYQDAFAGGPVTGLLGGAQAYVFQRDHVTRATATPGSSTIYQFDEVQGGRGCVAPHSMCRIHDRAFYLGSDGFYQFDVAGGACQPLGMNKWRSYVQNDIRAGQQLNVLGAADPINPVIMWAYVSRDNGGLTPDRILVYNWTLDEATLISVNVEALAGWLTGSVTLDTMNSYGDLDHLPYSLDSPFWQGGNSILGVFGTDHTLGYLQGPTLAATFETADGMGPTRAFVTGTEPLVDASAVTVAVAMRERDGDASSGVVNFGMQEAMEDTGYVPAHASGNIARARVQIPAGSQWSLMKGVNTRAKKRGIR